MPTEDHRQARGRVVVVSSFVLPHLGGVEQYVKTTSEILRRRGWDVRVVACRMPGGETDADVVLPTRYLPPAEWPLPVGGWDRLRREIHAADVVVANGTRQLLPLVALVAARRARTPSVVILHGGDTLVGGRLLYHRILAPLFDRLVAGPVVRSALAAAPSRSGVVGAERTYHLDARYLPFPLRDLPPAGDPRDLAPDAPLEVVWTGRLFVEKHPLGAVTAVERLRATRAATLDVYGDGPLRPELEALAGTRDWLRLHPSRTWDEIQDVVARAHVCLSTSLRDAAQLAVLEALCRGIPVVSTTVGDAPGYYTAEELRRFCVPPDDPDAAGQALAALASEYDAVRERFAANGRTLLQRHRGGAEDALIALLEDARRAGRA